MAGEPTPRASGAAASALPRVVLPFKDLGLAKSRLAEVPPALRGRIAQLMLLHTVRCWLALPAEVAVVSATPGLVRFLGAYGLAPGEHRLRVIADPGHGLNAAFRAGAATAVGDALVVATMADLPALATGQLAAALAQCQGAGRWFVPDADGLGSTLLAARGEPLNPLFGSDSARRHRDSGAAELTAEPGLRRDVDTVAELALAAAKPTLSPELSVLLEDGRPVRHQTAVIADPAADGLRLLLEDGTTLGAPWSAVPPDLPRPHPGQRVHLGRAGDGTVRQLWI